MNADICGLVTEEAELLFSRLQRDWQISPESNTKTGSPRGRGLTAVGGASCISPLQETRRVSPEWKRNTEACCGYRSQRRRVYVTLTSTDLEKCSAASLESMGAVRTRADKSIRFGEMSPQWMGAVRTRADKNKSIIALPQWREICTDAKTALN